MNKRYINIVSALTFILGLSIVYFLVTPRSDELSSVITAHEWYETNGNGIIYFNEDNEFGYYCDCGSPIDNYDACDSYTYDEKKKIITVKCSIPGIVNKLKIVESSENKFVLDFEGELRYFEPEISEY